MATPQGMIPTLQITNGASPGRLYQLDKEITILGRNPDCDIILAPKSVSRKHAVIVRKLAGYELKDLGSTRGTYVDGQKLTQAVFLKDGNTIQMGEVLLNFSSRLVQIEEGDDQSTVFAAIDVLSQSDKHFPMVKPEAKFRALRLIGSRARRHARPERSARTHLQLPVRDLPPRRARVCLAQGRGDRRTCCRRSSALAAGRPASSRSARRCSIG